MISGEKIYCHLANGGKPVTADIFLTDICNNNCPYCVYTAHTRRYGRSIRFSDFQRYVNRLLDFGVQGIVLTGGGEPTMNPDFGKITNWLERQEIHYGINTNFNVYRECHPDYLKVSLDGYSRESYFERRGVDAYERTIDNIKKFAKRRGKTKLGIQMLATCADEIDLFYRAHAGLDVDYMSFRPMESRHGEYYRDQEHLGEPKRILERISAIQDERVFANYKWGNIFDDADSCPGHKYAICVNPSGEVQYCCHKPNEIIGHILDKDILEKYESAAFNGEDCDVPCRMSGVNHALKRLSAVTEKEFL